MGTVVRAVGALPSPNTALLLSGKSLVFMNTRAGWKFAPQYFASSLQLQLDRIGAVYETVLWKGVEAEVALRCRNPADYSSIIICGGDGSINFITTQMCLSPKGAEWCQKPILCVPSGEHNGLATSLGITSHDASVAAANYGKIRQVPIWEVRAGGFESPAWVPVAPPSPTTSEAPGGSTSKLIRGHGEQRQRRIVSLMLGQLQLGLPAHVSLTASAIKTFSDDFVAMPALMRRHWWASLYWLGRMESFPISITVHQRPEGSNSGQEVTETISMESARGLVAAQARYLHRGYSLTPEAPLCSTNSVRGGEAGARWQTGAGRDASKGAEPVTVDPSLSVTLLGNDVTRLRAYHLLHKEAPTLRLLQEDGVRNWSHVRRLSISLKDPSKRPLGDATAPTDIFKGAVSGSRDEEEPLGPKYFTRLGLIDGEVTSFTYQDGEPVGAGGPANAAGATPDEEEWDGIIDIVPSGRCLRFWTV